MFNTKESFIDMLRVWDAQENSVAKATYEQNLANYAKRKQHQNPGVPMEDLPNPPKKVQREPVFEPTWGHEVRTLTEPVSWMTLADVMPFYSADDPSQEPGSPIGVPGRIVSGVQTYRPSSTDYNAVGAMYMTKNGQKFVKSGDSPFSHFWIKIA